MKQINIKTSKPANTNGVFKNQKVYRVYLGTGKPLSYKNKQVADNFASFVSKEINKFIRISNIIYGDLFKMYRTVWPGMDAQSVTRINEYCEKLNHSFNLVYKRESTEAFSSCYAIFKCLNEFVAVLDAYLKLKKMYCQIYQLDTIEATLNSNSTPIQIIKSRTNGLDE